jgi:hypothetical protein
MVNPAAVVAVTDKKFRREIFPDFCSFSFITVLFSDRLQLRAECRKKLRDVQKIN